VRFHRVLSERFEEVDDVFVEPVPNDDPNMLAEAEQTRAV